MWPGEENTAVQRPVLPIPFLNGSIRTLQGPISSHFIILPLTLVYDPGHKRHFPLAMPENKISSLG